jgi:hypothetical protein
MVTPGAKRDAVAHARKCYGLSERRACHLIGIPRRVARYKPSRPDDTHLRQRLRELAAARRPETGAADQGANGAATRAEPALVVGLCL